MARTIHFFVARKADGTPLFMQIQAFMSPLEQLHKSIETSLLCRDDVDHCTIHLVNADETFSLIDTMRRDGRTGFSPCKQCSTLVYHEKHRCKQCDAPVCEVHRTKDAAWMKWLCLDCAATQK